MDAKLTLKLDKNVIEDAKKYAALHKKSLSRMFEDYLKSINQSSDYSEDKDLEISPFVKSMKTGVKLPDDFDYKKEYREFLEGKYK